MLAGDSQDPPVTAIGIVISLAKSVLSLLQLEWFRFGSGENRSEWESRVPKGAWRKYQGAYLCLKFIEP